MFPVPWGPLSRSARQTTFGFISQVEKMAAALKNNGAYYIDNQQEVDKVRESAFPNGVFNECTGGYQGAQCM